VHSGILDPELVQAVNEAKAQNARTILRDDDDVVFRLGDSQEKENIPDYVDSSPPPRNLRSLVDTSDVESDGGSIDSIQRNADFVAF
jgi:hypothetical protein